MGPRDLLAACVREPLWLLLEAEPSLAGGSGGFSGPTPQCPLGPSPHPRAGPAPRGEQGSSVLAVVVIRVRSKNRRRLGWT